MMGFYNKVLGMHTEANGVVVQGEKLWFILKSETKIFNFSEFTAIYMNKRAIINFNKHVV